MTAAESARLTLLVLYSDRMEECRAFYSALGLCFAREQHGQGPQHYAAVLDDGSVFEIYPLPPEKGLVTAPPSTKPAPQRAP